MKLGVNLSIWSHAGISFLEGLRRAKALGFKYIDLLGTGHLDPLTVDNKVIKAAKDLIGELDLYVSSMVMLPRIVGNIASSDQKIRDKCLEYVKACIDVTAELGGRQVLMDGREKEIDIPFDIAWENSRSFITEASRYAKDKDVIITLELEPCVYSIVKDIPSMFNMISEVNCPNVLANVDIGHLAITREAPQDLQKLKGLVIHAHISDNNGRIHANEIIGTGVTLVKEYLEALLDIGIDEAARRNNVVPVAGLELGLIGQSIDNPDNWVKKSLEFVLEKCTWINLT